MIPNLQQTTRVLVTVQVNEILKDGEMHWAPSGHWPVPWKTQHRQRRVKQDPWNFPDQQNVPKIRKKIALRCETPKSPQISGRVESLRLNASASVSIWYVDPIKVAFCCHHIATCFAFKVCAWHVVSQHKGCNKIGNRRPNLCTWFEEGLRSPSWFEVSILGIDLRTSQYSHNRHKCWHTALNVSDAIRCVSNTSEMPTANTLRSWGGSCLNRTPPRKLSIVAPDKYRGSNSHKQLQQKTCSINTYFDAWTGDANHSDENTNLTAKGETHPPDTSPQLESKLRKH